LDFTSVAIDTVNDRVYCTIQPSGYIGARGIILVLDYDGNYITSYEAGYGPDMVTVSADGRYVFTADEGEPRAAAATDVSLDPPGSVTIVDTMGTTDLTDDTVTHVGFDDTTKIDDDVHIKGIETDSTTGLLIQRSKTDPYATNDLEPEYVTLSEDGLTAYVTLQEANAIATIDVATKTLVSVKSLGYKDLSLRKTRWTWCRNQQQQSALKIFRLTVCTCRTARPPIR
jgi:DNA-binding beta-propeller fold protein YncE